MELIFGDPYYDSPDEGKDFSPELRGFLTDLDEDASISKVDVGHGADCPAYLVQVLSSVDWSTLLAASGAGGAFFLGKKINENIDSWIEITEKLRTLISKLQPSRIDENAAALLTLNECFRASLLKGEFSVSVEIVEGSPVPWGKFTLDRRPDALYIVTVKTEERAFIRGIKSNGAVVFDYQFGLGWYEFFDT